MRAWAHTQVVKFLGKGSYGSVFQVQRLGDGQTYALKVRCGELGRGGLSAAHVAAVTSLAPRVLAWLSMQEMDVRSMSQAEREDSVNEIRLLASVSHPNVIGYNEAFLDGNRL